MIHRDPCYQIQLTYLFCRSRKKKKKKKNLNTLHQTHFSTFELLKKKKKKGLLLACVFLMPKKRKNFFSKSRLISSPPTPLFFFFSFFFFFLVRAGFKFFSILKFFLKSLPFVSPLSPLSLPHAWSNPFRDGWSVFQYENFVSL
jgi:hypothetical protein